MTTDIGQRQGKVPLKDKSTQLILYNRIAKSDCAGLRGESTLPIKAMNDTDSNDPDQEAPTTNRAELARGKLAETTCEITERGQHLRTGHTETDKGK